jgi:hypothetical protein
MHTYRDRLPARVDRILHAARSKMALDLQTDRRAKKSDMFDRAALSLKLNDQIQASTNSILA